MTRRQPNGPLGVFDGTGTSVGALLEAAAQQRPTQEALVFLPADGAAPVRRTYAELIGAARRAAGWLAGPQGLVRPGDRVAIWAANAPDWVVAQLGCYLAGVVLVPINSAYGAEEAGALLADADVRAVLHDRPDDLAAEACRRPGAVAVTLTRAAREWRGADERAVYPSTDTLAQIQFTSGTTGRPKGAGLTHGGLTTTPVVAVRCLGLPPGARWLNTSPLCYISGCVFPVIGGFSIGTTHLLAERYSADAVLRTFGAERVSFFGGVPTMWWDLLDRYDPARHDVSSLEVLMTGGAPVPQELALRAEGVFGARIVISYGQTEAHGPVAQTHIAGFDEPGATSPAAVGYPLPHARLEVLRDDGTPAEVDEVGELVCHTSALMTGYIGRPEETRRVLDAPGRLRTGDVGRIDADGVVTFVGRNSDLIVRGGEKVAPAEIEAVLLGHPAVTRVAVAGVPDHRLGQRVAAFVVPREGSDPSPADLAAFVAGRLARVKVPDVWQLVPALPVNDSGKVAKDRLVAQWSAQAIKPAGTAAS